MKKVTISMLCIIWSVCCFGQSKDEIAVRRIDTLELQAFLTGDTLLLDKLWSPNYVVTNPYNKVVTVSQIKSLMRKERITQVKFTRTLEKITFNENIALVMGTETPDTKTAAPNVPKNVLAPRRFTNIWMKNTDKWTLIGRQATNIGEIGK